MQDFILVHRKQNGNPLALNVPTWTTCLRQIAFLKNWELDDAKTQVTENDEVFEGYKALQFLIQVVCGLQSTLIGETEVHGQFKKFILEHPELKNLGEAVLVASKRVRTEHLMDLGSQSYGSFIRKKVVNDRVSIVGAGMLTQEILPWLKKVSQVDLHVRNPEKAQALKAQFPFIKIKSLEEKVSSSILVIAAPIENSMAIELINSNVSAVYDLRGGQSLNIQNQKLNYESLPVIMEQIQKTQVVLRTKLMASEIAINRVAEEILKKLWLRPGGWEDLCG
jgi:glutamyl-tRNA reductase